MIIQKRLNTLLELCMGLKQPKVTIALPTHRFVSESKQDIIHYGNLLKQVKAELETRYPKEDWEQTYSSLEKIKSETVFWNHVSDSLVIMACGNQLEIFHLNYKIEPVTAVGVSFHVQPLFIFKELLDDYYLVNLAKDRVKIYEVNMGVLDEIKPKDLKMKFSELFTDIDSNTNFNTASYSGGTGISHGHRDKSGEEDKYREKYFRYLDAEFKQLNSETGKKIILSGTTDNISEFKALSQENFYLEEVINKPLSSMESKEIIIEIKELLKPKQEKMLKALYNEIENAQLSGKLLNEFTEIVTAANEGRISKVIIPEGNGKKVNNQLDEMLIHALNTGAEIHVLKYDNKVLSELVAIIRY